MSPPVSHLMCGMIHTHSAKFPGEIVDQSTAIIVRQPVFKIVQTRKISPGTLSPAVTVQLDVMQKLLWRPGVLRVVEHAGEPERVFEKGPAIHSVKISGRRFNP